MLSRDTIIEVKNLSKTFGTKKVLDNVTLNIYENEILLIIGLSGTGKSTLLRLVSGLDESDSGSISVKTSKISMVFQGAALFDSMNVFDNVAFPLVNSSLQISPQTIKEKVLEKLRMVGLAGIENSRPDELSGGMKKRVSFARAIINDPKIILYDEPTSGLDPVVSNIVFDYIIKLHTELTATSILVLHDLELIKRHNARTILFYQGKIVWEGLSQDLFTTNNPYAKQFREGNPIGPMEVIKEPV